MPRAQSISFLGEFLDIHSSKGFSDVSPLQFRNVQSAGTAKNSMQRKPTPSFGGVIFFVIVARIYALPEKLWALAQGLQTLYCTYYLRRVGRVSA